MERSARVPIDATTYRSLIADVRRQGVPSPIVQRHLQLGFRTGRLCGACVNYRRAWEGEHSHCARCFTADALPAETPACGRFEERATSAV